VVTTTKSGPPAGSLNGPAVIFSSEPAISNSYVNLLMIWLAETSPWKKKTVTLDLVRSSRNQHRLEQVDAVRVGDCSRGSFAVLREEHKKRVAIPGNHSVARQELSQWLNRLFRADLLARIAGNPAAYEQALTDEFDQLYEEGARKRRMMVVLLHDRISGHANRVRVLDRFLAYAKSKPGVWFARKDEIAKWAIEHRSITPVYNRGAPTVTGLPGSAT
jgi:hypothetical protein